MKVVKQTITVNMSNSNTNKNAIYFLSDVHLSLNNGDVEKLVVKFLNSIKDKASHLYILGDLFDFWLEYEHVIPAGYLKTLSTLLNLSESGVKIFYLPGNHDFWMMDYLERQAGIKLCDDTYEAEHSGKKIHFYHGDGLAYGDHGYRFIKKLFRNRFLISLYKLLPVDLAYRIANKSSHTSRQYTSNKPKDLQGYYDYAARKIREGADVVMVGHTHYPEMKYLEDGLYINTGDWLTHNTYVVLENGEFKLETFEGHC